MLCVNCPQQNKTKKLFDNCFTTKERKLIRHCMMMMMMIGFKSFTIVD